MCQYKNSQRNSQRVPRSLCPIHRSLGRRSRFSLRYQPLAHRCGHQHMLWQGTLQPDICAGEWHMPALGWPLAGTDAAHRDVAVVCQKGYGHLSATHPHTESVAAWYVVCGSACAMHFHGTWCGCNSLTRLRQSQCGLDLYALD
jgi:hypothetical protein